MYVNVDKLNGKIAERRITKIRLADKIGINNSTLYRRLKNGKLLIGDVHKICDVLNLSTDESIEIFLAQ